MNYYCYFNSKILRKDQIHVNVSDLALTRGYAVFDYLRTYNGIPFRIKDYLVRFENSAKEMNLNIPISKKQIIATVEQLLQKNGIKSKSKLQNFGVRFLLTGGYAEDIYSITQPNFLILIEDLPVYPSWQFTKGIKLNLWEHQRELPFVKTINYLTAIKLSGIRKKLGVQDTLYHHNDKILECTRNNFFLFHGNTLVTAGSKVLQGITRKTILQLAHKKFNIEIRDISLDELSECTECFITGSTRGACPVVSVEKMGIGNGKAGKNTKVLMSMFNESTK